ARAISIIADYDCYYLRTRPDGSNATSQRPDYPALLTIAEDLVQAVFEHRPPGVERDHLMRRHVRLAIMSSFNRWWLHNLTLDEQRQIFDQAHALLTTCVTDGVLAGLEPVWRFRTHLVVHNEFDAFMRALPITHEPEPPAVVEDGRVYLPYPHFREPGLDIPDSVYDATDRVRVQHRLDELAWSRAGLRVRGAAALTYLADREVTARLLLRERTTKATVAIPVTMGAADGELVPFGADVDLATADGGSPVPNGLWDVSLEVTADGFTREARFGSRRDDALGTEPTSHAVTRGPGAEVVATAFFTRHGNLGIDVGEHTHSAFPRPRLTSLRSSATALRLELDYPASSAAGLSAEVHLVRGSVTRSVQAQTTVEDDSVRLSASLLLPVLRLRPGTWDVRVSLTSGDLRRDLVLRNQKGKPVHVKVMPGLNSLRKRVRGR
ncbi:MAG TPA: hypothetical protein VGF17_16455, partial [Phytomonospora sp.]